MSAISQSTVPYKFIALLAMMLGSLAPASAFSLEWVGTTSILTRSNNWSPVGLPMEDLSGNVSSDFATTVGSGTTLTTYNVTWNGDSTFTGLGQLNLNDGTALIFNGSVVFSNASELRMGQVGTNAVSLTFNGNASGVVNSNVRFGDPSTTSPTTGGSVTISLNDNSTLLFGDAGGATLVVNGSINETRHYLNLADQAVFTMNSPSTGGVVFNTGGQLVVNFIQTNKLVTPIWRFSDVLTAGNRNFNAANIIYQINGEDTTLADSRFVYEPGVDGYNLLYLAVVPEPSTQ
jgi:hypothetical protein